LPRTPERGYVYEYFVRDRLTPAETVGYVPNMTYDRYIPPQQQVEAPPVDEPIIVQSTEESAS